MKIAGIIVIALGALWFIISSVGILRMPDFYTRIHAGAKASTLAALLVVAGATLVQPAWWPKLLLIGLFLLLTNPIGASVLARAAYRSGEAPMPQGKRDDYASASTEEKP